MVSWCRRARRSDRGGVSVCASSAAFAPSSCHRFPPYQVLTAKATINSLSFVPEDRSRGDRDAEQRGQVVADAGTASRPSSTPPPNTSTTWSPTCPVWGSGAPSAKASSGRAEPRGRPKVPSSSATTGADRANSSAGRVTAMSSSPTPAGSSPSSPRREAGSPPVALPLRAGRRQHAKVTESYEVQWLPLWARILDGPAQQAPGAARPHVSYARAAQGSCGGERRGEGAVVTLEVASGGLPPRRPPG